MVGGVIVHTEAPPTVQLSKLSLSVGSMNPQTLDFNNQSDDDLVICGVNESTDTGL